MFRKGFVFGTVTPGTEGSTGSGGGRKTPDAQTEVNIVVTASDLYRLDKGYSFVTEKNRREQDDLRLPELNSGFDTLYWYRDSDLTEIREDAQGCFLDCDARNTWRGNDGAYNDLLAEYGAVCLEVGKQKDVKQGALKDVDVVINAGCGGSAWSGGESWKDGELVTLLTEWVHKGGTFLGVNEPSAVEGYDNYFRMAHVLGIDEDTGSKVCHCKGIFLASFQISLENTRLLYHLIRYAGDEGLSGLYMTDNLYTECAYYPESGKLVVINNSDREQTTTVPTKVGDRALTIAPYDTVFVEL